MRALQLFALTLLGCASAVGARPLQDSQDSQEPETGQDRQDPAHAFEPIRFGDLPEHAYGRPLLPGREYDPDLPTPDEVLGQAWGSRIVSHDKILQTVVIDVARHQVVDAEVEFVDLRRQESVRTGQIIACRVEFVCCDRPGRDRAHKEKTAQSQPALDIPCFHGAPLPKVIILC